MAVDNGGSFVNADFKAALTDLGIAYEVLPAGVPKLRGRIERVFRTFGTLLMPHLTGRTFSNPQERGDYPSDKYVVHAANSIVELMVLRRRCLPPSCASWPGIRDTRRHLEPIDGALRA